MGLGSQRDRCRFRKLLITTRLRKIAPVPDKVLFELWLTVWSWLRSFHLSRCGDLRTQWFVDLIAEEWGRWFFGHLRSRRIHRDWTHRIWVSHIILTRDSVFVQVGLYSLKSCISQLRSLVELLKWVWVAERCQQQDWKRLSRRCNLDCRVLQS